MQVTTSNHKLNHPDNKFRAPAKPAQQKKIWFDTSLKIIINHNFSWFWLKFWLTGNRTILEGGACTKKKFGWTLRWDGAQSHCPTPCGTHSVTPDLRAPEYLGPVFLSCYTILSILANVHFQRFWQVWGQNRRF